MTSGGLRSDLLLREGSGVRPDQAAQAVTRSGLSNLPGWRLHSLSWWPFPTLDCAHGETHVSWRPAKTSRFNLCHHLLFSCHALRAGHLDELLPGTEGCCSGPLKPPLLHAEQAQHPQPPLTAQVLQLPCQLGGPPRTPSSLSRSFLEPRIDFFFLLQSTVLVTKREPSIDDVKCYSPPFGKLLNI